MDRKLLVDGTETTMQEFLHANTAPGCEITVHELQEVMKLKVGETVVVGISFITRADDE